MTPVSPIPPIVARNSAPLSSRVSSRSSPDAVNSVTAVTWSPNVPSAAWFLPWMSQAIAPPTVTCWVPGTTGSTQPAGPTAASSRPSETPACAWTMPRSASSENPVSPVVSSTRPWSSWAASP